jgi:hypothetical protein
MQHDTSSCYVHALPLACIRVQRTVNVSVDQAYSVGQMNSAVFSCPYRAAVGLSSFLMSPLQHGGASLAAAAALNWSQHL